MRIDRCEVLALTWPLERVYWTSSGAINAVHELVVRLSTDDGLVGIGQAHGRPIETLARIVRDGLAPLVIGLDSRAVAWHWERMFALTTDRRAAEAGWSRQQIMAAVGAVDIALWDLLGQAAGLPLWRLLGGYSPRVRGYGSGGYYWEGWTPDGVAKEMAGYVAQGFTAVKMKVGGVSLAEDVARVRAVREAIGPNVDLLLDANRSYSVAGALEAARAFAPYDIYWFEDTLRWNDELSGLPVLAQRSPIRLTAGEPSISSGEVRNLLGAGGFEVLMYDATWGGGLTEGRRAATLAQTHHVWFSPHHDPQIHIHLAGAFPNALILETFPDPARDPLWANLFTERATIEDGYVVAPERPGLGVTFDEAILRRYTQAVST